MSWDLSWGCSWVRRLHTGEACSATFDCADSTDRDGPVAFGALCGAEAWATPDAKTARHCAQSAEKAVHGRSTYLSASLRLPYNATAFEFVSSGARAMFKMGTTVSR